MILINKTTYRKFKKKISYLDTEKKSFYTKFNTYFSHITIIKVNSNVFIVKKQSTNFTDL